jgi:hypothetical protein
MKTFNQVFPALLRACEEVYGERLSASQSSAPGGSGSATPGIGT